jgi:tetratricopeptide (TPR) repeat protein
MQRMSVPALETLVRQQPGNTQALYRLGMAYAHENRYHDATNTLLAVLDKDPVRADVMNDLGVVYLLQERYYESLTALNGALTARPNYAAALANLGRLHLATKMPFTAAGELERAVKSDPSDGGAWCDLGEAYQQTLNLQAAKRAYQSALALNGHSVRANVGLGKTEYSLAQYAEAEKTLNQALTLAPDDAQTLLTLARLHLEQAATDADLQSVQQLLDHAARVDPENPDIWYDQGRVALRRGKAAEAVDLLTKTLRMSPGHNAAMHQLERALRAVGRTADANRVARVFEARSLRDREETHLEEVVAHNPQDWDSQAQLTEIYLQSGNRGLALLVFRRMLQGAPHHPALPKIQHDLNRQFAPSPSAPAGTRAPQ